jgi:hypothetical protein
MIRTVDEAFAAGARDAAADPPLTAQQVTAIAALLAPWRPGTAGRGLSPSDARGRCTWPGR